jgi:hypothetical protein
MDKIKGEVNGKLVYTSDQPLFKNALHHGVGL